MPKSEEKKRLSPVTEERCQYIPDKSLRRAMVDQADEKPKESLKDE